MPHEYLFLFNQNRIAAVRSGRWKLVVESRYRSSINSFEQSDYYGPNGLLFGLQTDPSERYSYTREHPEIAQRLNEELTQARKVFGAAKLPEMWNPQ
ncbi:MAG: hypothetical protein OXE78_09560 [Gammaproteobacteria bacterium]|nr:hypothetical protein [Gammaproteobacteria bacterium]MCY4357535.1 hypothetical protein [Gammaproteobacteria bacterium]